MKKITVGFVDFWPGFSIEDCAFYKVLKEKYDVEISIDPQYLFFGPYGDEHLKYNNKIKIFSTGENISPDFNLCDYALGFDYLEFGDRYLRRPNFYGRENEVNLAVNRQSAIKTEKTEFCSFVVSKSTKSTADPIREEFFHKLCEYKKVNSGGRFLNNIGMPDGVPNKLEFQKKHKFAIAFENGSQPGYTTEKLLDAFAAGGVPIYWGDPWVDRVFNPKSFINVADYDTLDAAVQAVIRIDNDDSEYQKMLEQPVFINEYDLPVNMTERLRSFLFNIIEQPYENARRRPTGLYINEYEEKLLPLVNRKYVFHSKVKRKIKSIGIHK